MQSFSKGTCLLLQRGEMKRQKRISDIDFRRDINRLGFIRNNQWIYSKYFGIRIRWRGEVISWLTPPIFGATTFFFPFYFGNSIATIFFFLLFRQCHCHNFFFPSISTMQLPQFFWLLDFFFPPIFSNLVATLHIFSLLPSLQFRQLSCHNWFPSRHST